MDLYLDDSYLNVKEVTSCFLQHKPEKKIIKTGKLWWKETKEEEIPRWQITMQYLSSDGQRYTFTSSSDDYKDMLAKFKNLMEQLKTYGMQWADRALENAIINGGTNDGSTN